MELNKLAKKALKKGASCKRLNEEEAYSLIDSISSYSFHQIGESALKNRQLRYGNNATYIFNVHINPTNICESSCVFCNYAASKNSNHAYVMDEIEIYKKIDRLHPTEVHIVGGLNQVWPYYRNLNLIRSLHKRYPKLYIKAFTAVEIEYFAKTSKLSECEILDELQLAGLDAMTGGGAEIFSDRLYKKYWKNKTSPFDWQRIHKLAHSKNIPTNATMLFGFGDTWYERVKHLLILRDLQEESGGFSCFIPLPFQSRTNMLVNKNLAPLEILFVIAMSRLILNNIPHIKSYWPMVGVASSSVGLSWGADDIDGTITEEKIAHFSGATTPVGMVSEEMVETIIMAGFIPQERKGNFDPKYV